MSSSQVEAEQVLTYDPESQGGAAKKTGLGGRPLPVSDDVIRIPKTPASRKTYRNFLFVATMLSINYACTGNNIYMLVARFGAVGAWQSGAYFLALTLSATTFATYITKVCGSKQGMVIGLTLLTFYSFSTALYTIVEQSVQVSVAGAAVGGIGAGIMWTAQGVYFGQSADNFAREQDIDSFCATSMLAGTFGFVFLTCETLMRLVSTVILSVNPEINWGIIFGVYSLVGVVTTCGMIFAYEYPLTENQQEVLLHKIESVFFLMMEDPKMKYLVPYSLALGFGNAFVNSFVNGEVIEIALEDENNQFVGLFSAFNSAVAAAVSLMFATWFPEQKPLSIVMGGLACIGTALPFVIYPQREAHTWGSLFLVHGLWGIARSTYESTYKAVFADMFPTEKDGAFASLVLQNALASSIGFTASYSVFCKKSDPLSKYCVLFDDGKYHNVMTMSLLFIATSAIGVFCYFRAHQMYQREREVKSLIKTNTDLELS